MKLRSVKKEFLKRIEPSNRSPDVLVPSEGIDLMLGFYREERLEACHSDADGDMLLYQWGTYDWGDAESFELDIIRQLIVDGGEDEDILRLSLTFKFQPTLPLRQFGDGNRWCRALEELEEFREYIYSSSAFLTVEPEVPSDVQLEYGAAG
jgi:hypothetical protein